MEVVEQLGALRYPLTFAVALALSLYFTPVIRTGAIKYGVVDAPDGRLKVQDAPVAYLGGVAIYLAFLFALALTHEFDERVLGLLLSASIVVMLGLFDDLKVLTPGAKLLGQAVATLVLIKADIMIRLSFLPEGAAVALTFIWILGCTNAINLIDVSDALAGSVAFVAASFLVVVAFWNGNSAIVVLALALMGSTLGFLVYNRPPARIYLGDTGSMLLGFLLGALAMSNHYTFVHPWAAVAPVLILGVPIFDTLFVMGVRRYHGIPVMRGSPDHFAVRLRRRGLGPGAIAGIGAGCSAALGGAALAVCLQPPPVTWGVVGASGVAALGAAAVLLRLGRGAP